MLRQSAWRGLHRADREWFLAKYGTLASNAAAWALKEGDADSAVSILEEGRAVLWAEVLDARGDVSQLRLVAPDLAGRLDELAHQLEGTILGLERDAGE